MDADIAAHLARNLKQLRAERGLTQARCAALADVPRPTWTSLESGVANPTLTVVCKVAASLGVTLDELIAAPRTLGRHYPASSLPERRQRGVVVRQLLPDPLAGLQIERLTFAPGARLSGTPHIRGAREYLTCERGRVGLTVAGTSYELDPGDVVAFRGDEKHGYANLAASESLAYSVITLFGVRT